MPWNKVHNPPSIPSHDFVFGYEEEQGELVRQRNTDNKHTGEKTDTVGPGEYDIPRGLGKSRGVPQWHPPRQPKKSALSSLAGNRSATAVIGPSADTPGPGYYIPEKAEVFPLYKYKQSSAFASKVDRQGQRMRNSVTGMMTLTTGSKFVSKTHSALGAKGLNPLSPQNGDPQQ